MRRRLESDLTVIACALIVGTPIYLLMEHPVIFWLVFVPLAVILVKIFIGWLKK